MATICKYVSWSEAVCSLVVVKLDIDLKIIKTMVNRYLGVRK